MPIPRKKSVVFFYSTTFKKISFVCGGFQVESLHLEQANTDFYILCELLKDYIGLLGAVRDAFHERTKLFQHWQHSQQMLAKKREAKAKFELQNRTDKLDQANAEVTEVSVCSFFVAFEKSRLSLVKCK